MTELLSAGELELARRFKQLFSAYRRSRDLIAVGAYVRGADPVVDRAVALYPQLTAFLQQDLQERADVASCRARLRELLGLMAAPFRLQTVLELAARRLDVATGGAAEAARAPAAGTGQARPAAGISRRVRSEPRGRAGRRACQPTGCATSRPSSPSSPARSRRRGPRWCAAGRPGRRSTSAGCGCATASRRCRFCACATSTASHVRDARVEQKQQDEFALKRRRDRAVLTLSAAEAAHRERGTPLAESSAPDSLPARPMPAPIAVLTPPGVDSHASGTACANRPATTRCRSRRCWRLHSPIRRGLIHPQSPILSAARDAPAPDDSATTQSSDAPSDPLAETLQASVAAALPAMQAPLLSRRHRWRRRHRGRCLLRPGGRPRRSLRAARPGVAGSDRSCWRRAVPADPVRRSAGTGKICRAARR